MSLPAGFTVRIHDDVRTADQGRALIGGSPLRVVRLSPRAQPLIGNGEIRVNGAASAILADRLLDANIAIPVLRSGDRAEATELTVIVPARDRIGPLNKTLAGLAGLNVIVVDDASKDAAAIAELAKTHAAHIIRLDQNVGPAAARNAGLARVRTPFVAFVDSDVRVTTGTLLSLTSHFADPRVALVAPHVRGQSVNARPRWFERYEETSPSLGLGERPGVVRPGAAVAWLPSACLVGRTERLVAIGGFDERMRVGEDVDLVWRLAAAGERVRYDPAHEARHDARPTLRAWMGRKFVYGTGGAALAERHPGKLVTASFSPVMGVAALALLMRRPWSVPVALAATARGAQVLLRALPRGTEPAEAERTGTERTGTERTGTERTGTARTSTERTSTERRRLAVRLSARGLGWAVRQESALVLRHWWPAVFGAAVVSRRARRVIVSAMVVDLLVGTGEAGWRKPFSTFAGRRLDDVAYGAGLWWGALRSGSLSCLGLRVPGDGRSRSQSCRQDSEPAKVAKRVRLGGNVQFQTASRSPHGSGEGA
ncbi:MAG: mycofactocin biosynthesis glycosyltransferase MftF [Nocardiopsaceae bacterium]|jgi:mycofactocin system glycosyltransferase|nr:mycofactocin biosynthesis glycosyltransferase MftF [Nocardiopsaceae bacterium]